MELPSPFRVFLEVRWKLAGAMVAVPGANRETTPEDHLKEPFRRQGQILSCEASGGAR